MKYLFIILAILAISCKKEKVNPSVSNCVITTDTLHSYTAYTTKHSGYVWVTKSQITPPIYLYIDGDTSQYEMTANDTLFISKGKTYYYAGGDYVGQLVRFRNLNCN